jgi:hypothetical protein
MNLEIENAIYLHQIEIGLVPLNLLFILLHDFYEQSFAMLLNYIHNKDHRE